MEGVILFADDNIFDDGFENRLFKEFLSDEEYNVLPVNDLLVLENSISSISTFRALIIDWNFKRAAIDGDEFVKVNDENPFEFLKKTKLFSIVYVYSQEDISQDVKDELEQLYPNRIYFEKKNVAEDSKAEFEKLKKGIYDFETKNSHLQVPYVWSQAINESAQQIFYEFSNADKFWIKDLYYSSVRKEDKKTGVPIIVELEPTIEVINLFQNILSERLIQNIRLKHSISHYSHNNYNETPDVLGIAKLYSKLYYTPTLESDTVMTGDIYKLGDDCYGVIISPECDIMRLINKNEYVECLCFSVNSFDNISDFISTKKGNEKEKEELIRRAYNQENSAIHLLPIYEFDDKTRNTALIDFRFGLKLVKGKYLNENKKNRKNKLNTPYIQQLRQRYLSYIGRVGVPAIPNTLRYVPK